MDIAAIEAFLAVVRYGTISQAAEALYITQPALSRRIKALEQEVGCSLFQRQKGVRAVRLTEEGVAFLRVAEQWKYLWEETASISQRSRRPLLNVASVESVSLYLLPKVFRQFLQGGEQDLYMHQCHSTDGYRYIESGMGDLGFITDPMFSGTVKAVPAFSEPFVLASWQLLGDQEGVVRCCDLRPEDEVRFPWDPEFDAWHGKTFDARSRPSVQLDQVSLLDCFLQDGNWAIVPYSIGRSLEGLGAHIYGLQDGPPDRIIYYLTARDEKRELKERFLSLLDGELKNYPPIRSFLGSGPG